MTRRRLIIGASIAVAAVGCWWCVVRPVEELRLAGIRAWTGPKWHCDHSYTIAECFRTFPAIRRGAPPPIEHLAYCLTSLSLTRFASVRMYADSGAWMRARDSVDSVLSLRPRRREVLSLRASLSEAGVALAATRKKQYGVVSSWGLPRWQVSAYASRAVERAPDTSATFAVDVGAFRDASCSPPRWPRLAAHAHVITISEALAAIHRTIAEQIGF